MSDSFQYLQKLGYGSSSFIFYFLLTGTFLFKGGGTVCLLHPGNGKSIQVGYPEATTLFQLETLFLMAQQGRCNLCSLHRVSGVEKNTNFLYRKLQQKHKSKTYCKKTPKLSPQTSTAKPPSH